MLLQRLVVEAASVCCWGPPADGARSVNAALHLVTRYLQPTTPPDLDPLAVGAVLPPLWLGLGQALLAASGAAASQAQQHVEDNRHQTAGGSSRQQAGVAAPPQGLEQSKAAAAAQHMMYMWGQFSAALFMTCHWLDAGKCQRSPWRHVLGCWSAGHALSLALF